MIKKLEDKINKGRKLAEEFRAMGMVVDFNEKTGEISINSDQFIKSK